MAEVKYDPAKDNWWLSVGHTPTGKTYRSLTKALLTERWFACNVLEHAKFWTTMAHKPWHPVEVHLVKNGEYQSTDVI